MTSILPTTIIQPEPVFIFISSVFAFFTSVNSRDVDEDEKQKVSKRRRARHTYRQSNSTVRRSVLACVCWCVIFLESNNAEKGWKHHWDDDFICDGIETVYQHIAEQMTKQPMPMSTARNNNVFYLDLLHASDCARSQRHLNGYRRFHTRTVAVCTADTHMQNVTARRAHEGE